MDKKPLISIIIPVYNIAPYLPRCLDSLLNQTYKNLEIIVINDGSTDKSKDIILSYVNKDSRIKAINKENQGVGMARNLGLDIATGLFIGFVDGDDFIEPDMYEFLLNNIINYNAAISHCGYKMVFPNRTDLYYGTGERIIQDNQKGICDLLISKKIEPGVWNKLYRRELFNKIRFRKDIRNYEDLLINYYLFSLADKSIYHDEIKYNYVVRENSAATVKLSSKKILDPIYVVKEIEKQLRENDLIYPYAFYKYVSSHINSYNSILKEGNNTFGKEKKIIKEDLLEIFQVSKSTCLLTKKLKLISFLIMRCCILYETIYSIYIQFNKKDKYKVS